MRALSRKQPGKARLPRNVPLRLPSHRRRGLAAPKQTSTEAVFPRPPPLGTCAEGAPARSTRRKCAAFPAKRKRSLDGFCDLAALEAAGAHVGALRLAVQEHANALEI